jgi:hypothetical protein
MEEMLLAKAAKEAKVAKHLRLAGMARCAVSAAYQRREARRDERVRFANAGGAILCCPRLSTLAPRLRCQASIRGSRKQMAHPTGLEPVTF